MAEHNHGVVWLNMVLPKSFRPLGVRAVLLVELAICGKQENLCTEEIDLHNMCDRNLRRKAVPSEPGEVLQSFK